jgi:hypothetical protein
MNTFLNIRKTARALCALSALVMGGPSVGAQDHSARFQGAAIDRQKDALNTIIVSYGEARRKLEIEKLDPERDIVRIQSYVGPAGGYDILQKKYRITRIIIQDIDRAGASLSARYYLQRAIEEKQKGLPNNIALREGEKHILRAGGIAKARINYADWLRAGGEPLREDGTLMDFNHDPTLQFNRS